ncbi:MAG: hypothetical protein AB1598_12260 [Thermodesulfobacteriota bacterium]
MSKYLLILVVAALAVIYFFFPRGNDAGDIEAVFNKMIVAADNKDTDGVTEHFSLQYKGEYGESYPAVKNIIKKAIERYDRIEVSYSGLSVVFGKNESGEKEAAANLDVLVKGHESGMPHTLIGSDGSPDNVTVTLEKSGIGGWKITGVEGLDTPGDY